jgi:acyl-[acyl-carrier-protein]-phospholipid O-acyltransferase/long-chain-fatty-acid--[acyl-carrier-protein] ligase
MIAFTAHGLIAAAIWLVATGFMGGLFIVPLNAILQHRPAADEKGRTLATANFVNTVGIMFASAVVWLLHDIAHLSAAQVVGISAALTFAAAVWVLQIVPNFTTRFVIWFLTRTVYRICLLGAESVPRRGAALIVANHVTYVDGFLLSACVQRFVRFMVYQVWFDRFAIFFRNIHAIRVPDGTRRAIVQSIAAAREELKNGHVVCIFAEGSLTKTGNLAEFHRGLGKIVEGLDVPVIPAYLDGVWGSIFSLDRSASWARSIKKLPYPVSIAFGKPMFAPTAQEVRQAVLELAADAGAVECGRKRFAGKTICPVGAEALGVTSVNRFYRTKIDVR